MMQVEVEMRLPWVRMTPLGTPVLPLVYITMAGVSDVGGTLVTPDTAMSLVRIQ